MFAYPLAVIHICSLNWILVSLPDLYDVREKLTQASCDLSFGNKQVEQFICDRPDAGEVIRRDPVLRMVLVWYFAGELKGERVYWDYREPEAGGQPADHLPRFWGYPALVRVTNERGISGIDKCTMLVFELFNSPVDREIQLLTIASPDERKSRDEFAIACVRHEFEAAEKTKAFFLKHPLSNATVNNDPNYNQMVSSRMTFSDYLSTLGALDPKSFNPIKYYREGYDRKLPYQVRIK